MDWVFICKISEQTYNSTKQNTTKQARKQINKSNTWGKKFDMLLPNSTIILENTSSDLQDVKQTVEEVDNILIMQKNLSEF